MTFKYLGYYQFIMKCEIWRERAASNLLKAKPCHFIYNRDIGSYLKLCGQVVMWVAQSTPSGWDRVNWSAKIWMGNYPPCPHISYVPDNKLESKIPDNNRYLQESSYYRNLSTDFTQPQDGPQANSGKYVYFLSIIFENKNNDTYLSNNSVITYLLGFP